VPLGVEPPSCRAAHFDPGGAAQGDSVPGSPVAAMGTALTRAGPWATGLSRRRAGRPEVFYVPRGPARRLRVGTTRGRGVSRFPGGWGTGPRRLRPCARPAFADGTLWDGRWGRRREVLGAGRPHWVSSPDVGRAGCRLPPPGRRRQVYRLDFQTTSELASTWDSSQQSTEVNKSSRQHRTSADGTQLET